MTLANNTLFVTHVCKNPDCEKAFLAPDEYNAQMYPPQWRYCDECTAKGFKAKKSQAKVESGKRLSELRALKRQKMKDLEDLL